MLRVTYVDGAGYVAVATPPHAAEPWASDVPMSPTDLMETLAVQLGCHSTDVIDALDASGRDWRREHDAEVVRRRGATEDRSPRRPGDVRRSA